MGDPCAEPGCAYVGIRMCCYGPGCEMLPGESHNDYAARICRCSRHDVEHKQVVHGVAPEALFCTGCKKPLGLWTDTRSRAGAPWCGGCPKWWHESEPT